MRTFTLLIAGLMIVPAIALALDAPQPSAKVETTALPTAPTGPGGGPSPDQCPPGQCPRVGNIPFVVDEAGDTMTGPLVMQSDLIVTTGHTFSFAAGNLGTAGSTLTKPLFMQDKVDLANNPLHFAGGDLQSLQSGADLTFNGRPVCLANAGTLGCSGGDITGVIAGTGLLGGGLSGDVTVSADTSVLQARVSQPCTLGTFIRLIRQDGSVDCQPDANSGGTVTSVGAGAGLSAGSGSGGAITTSGTLSIAPNAVTSGMIQDGTILSSDVDASSIQLRLANNCASGSALRAVGADGGITCQAFVTRVDSGAGLTGGPITGTGTLAIADFGVLNGMLANGSVTTGKLDDFSVTSVKIGANAVTSSKILDGEVSTSDLANGAVTGAKTDATTVQARVTGTCAAGNYVRVVNQDGTVTCGSDANSGGTVTSVTGGTGLNGGTITGSGTLSVNTTQIQNRVTGSCAAGNYVRVVNQDGTVTCGSDANSGGTVTSIASGAGLTGGPVTGSGTLSIADGGVTNTMLQNAGLTITAGSGLTGGGSVNLGGATTLSIPTGGITSAFILDSAIATIDLGDAAVTTLKLADASVTLAKLAANSVDGSKVVDGSLAVADLAFDPATQTELDAHKASGDHDGRYFQKSELNTAGVVNDAANPVQWTKLKGVPTGFADGLDHRNARPVHSLTTLDSSDTGAGVSLTIDPDGMPLLSYYDVGNHDLKVAHCTDLRCSGAVITTVDSTGDVGSNTSLTIGPDGFGLIAYYDATNGDLKVAHCGNADCSTSVKTTVESGNDRGKFPSIVIGTDGFALISHYDATNGDLRLTHCTNADCSSSSAVIVEGNGSPGGKDVGQYTSLALSRAGNPILSYNEPSSGLNMAQCTDPTCTGTPPQSGRVVTAGKAGVGTSLVVLPGGGALVAYYDALSGDLDLGACPASTSGNASVECTDIAPAGFTATTLDPGGDSGAFPAMTLDRDARPIISYWDATNGDLKVLHCTTSTCTGWGVVNVDTGGTVGTHTSIALGADGLPLVAYRDETNHALKVLHCSNANCLPGYRPR